MRPARNGSAPGGGNRGAQGKTSSGAILTQRAAVLAEIERVRTDPSLSDLRKSAALYSLEQKLIAIDEVAR